MELLYSVNTSNSDQYVIVSPTRFTGNKRGILYINGAEADNGAYAWTTRPTSWPSFRTMANLGYTTLSCELGGSKTWGNDTAISRITDAYNQLLTLKGVSNEPILIIGQSMGGLNSLVWARTNKSLIHRMALFVPVINLTNVHDNSSYVTDIDAAYGGTYTEAAYGATHNPYTFAANGDLNGLVANLWYGTTDSLCLPQFATGIAGMVPSMTLTPVSGGHAESTIAQIDMTDLATFLTS